MTNQPPILDKRSYIPLHRQLFDVLLAEIKSGTRKAGERMPSERELADTYRVSRITVRQAIEALVKFGVVYREQGRGTFIANQNLGMFSFNSFTTDMQTRNKAPSTKVVSFELKQADENIAKLLKCKPGEAYYDVVRVRMADDKPVAIQYHNIPAHNCPDMEAKDMEEHSFFELLHNTYSIVPTWTEPIIRVIKASKFEQQQLQLKSGEPLIAVEATTYTDTFDIIEWVKTLYRSDEMTLHLGRQRIDNKI